MEIEKKRYIMNFSMKIKKISIVILVFVSIILVGLCCGANYMVDIGIKRGAGASSSINKTLNVSDDLHQIELEARATSLEDLLYKEAQVWAMSLDSFSEKATVQAEDGIDMVGYFFRQPDASVHKWAVIVHGYNGRASDFWNYAKKYYENGWNVFTPDLRASGDTGGKYIGMGWLDRRDLIVWINEIIRRDSEAQFVLHGFSMGAATIMMASGESDFPSAVKVCIEDAGYSSDWAEMEDKLHKIYHLPSFPLMNLASLFTKIKAGYSIREADCVKQLKKNKTPMLFIHGDKDDYNPFYMLDIVYNANACDKKEKLVVNGARHVKSAYVEPELYWNTVWNFIGKYY